MERVRNLENEVRWLKARKQKGGSLSWREEVLDLEPYLWTGGDDPPGGERPDGSRWLIEETPRLTCISFYQSGWQVYRHIFGEGVLRYHEGTDNFPAVAIFKGIADFGDTANPFLMAEYDWCRIPGVASRSLPTKAFQPTTPWIPPYHRFWLGFTVPSNQGLELQDGGSRGSFWDPILSTGDQPFIGDIWTAMVIGFPYYVTLSGSGALEGVMSIHYPDVGVETSDYVLSPSPTSYMLGISGGRYARIPRPDVLMDSVSTTDATPTISSFAGNGSATCTVRIPYEAEVGTAAGICFRLDEGNDRAYIHRYRVYMSGGVKKVRKELVWTQHEVDHVLWQDGQEWDLTPPDLDPPRYGFTRNLYVDSYWTPSGGQVINLGRSDANPFSGDVRVYRSPSDTKPMTDGPCGVWTDQASGSTLTNLCIVGFSRGPAFIDQQHHGDPFTSEFGAQYGLPLDGQAVTLANLQLDFDQLFF